MSPHSAGPWYANAIAKGRIIGDADTPGAEKIQINAGNCTVATVYRPKDARLIAASPALLSALVALEQAYSNKHSPQHRAACLNEARAVIARATGEQS